LTAALPNSVLQSLGERLRSRRTGRREFSIISNAQITSNRKNLMGSAARTFSANHPEAQEQPLPRLATTPMIALCSAKFLFHLLTSIQHYGYFRDELYYLDMARHLDWGYVDAAPLIAVYAKLSLLLGGSLAALRVLPALAGTALIALTMLIARELGGNRYAHMRRPSPGSWCSSRPACSGRTACSR
jgi:hypothetical protein